MSQVYKISNSISGEFKNAGTQRRTWITEEVFVLTILKTHRKKRMKRSLSLVLALAMTVTGLPGGLHSTGRAKAAEEIGKLAELTFDDANDPLLAGNAKAEAPNGYSCP